jgi:hypothetical protein
MRPSPFSLERVSKPGGPASHDRDWMDATPRTLRIPVSAVADRQPIRVDAFLPGPSARQIGASSKVSRGPTS